MAIQHPENWYLRKHDDNEIYGPVHFNKIKVWASLAQVAPNDAVSEDAVIWTKAPMIPELGMDFLVHVSEDSYYGPTTSGSLLEFFKLGEIKPETMIVNCVTGDEVAFCETEFFPGVEEEPESVQEAPERRSIRSSLQQRVRELELGLVERNRLLQMAEARIKKLEQENKELQLRAGRRGQGP